MVRFRYAFLIAAVSLAACKPEKEPGAIGTRFANPGGLALLGSSHLLVTSSNFQLFYEGGSVAAVDLAAVDESRRLNLTDDVVASAVPLDSFVGPVAVGPDGTTALVTNRLSDGERRSSPDRVFLVDVSDPSGLMRLDADPAADGEQSILGVGHDPYGVITLRLPPVGPGRPVRDRAIVANASEGSLALISLTPDTQCADGTPTPCIDDAVPPPRATEPLFTDAGEPSELTFQGPGVGPGVTRNESWEVTFIEAPGVCPAPPSPDIPAGYWRVEGSVSGVLRAHACTGLLYIGDSLRVTFTIARVTDDEGEPVGAPPTEGDQYLFDTYEGDLLVPSRLSLTRAVPGATIIGRGAGQLVHDPVRERIYVTSRRTNFIYVVAADDLRFLGAFSIGSNIGGIDSRGIAVAPDGSEIYVVNRGPDALVILDPDALPEQLEAKLVVSGTIDSIPLDSGPSELAISPDGRYAFVSVITGDAVNVIDLVQRVHLTTIHTADGPYSLRMSADGRRVYVATYFANSVDVIDSDPLSPTFLTVLTSIANADFDPDEN